VSTHFSHGSADYLSGECEEQSGSTFLLVNSTCSEPLAHDINWPKLWAWYFFHDSLISLRMKAWWKTCLLASSYACGEVSIYLQCFLIMQSWLKWPGPETECLSHITHSAGNSWELGEQQSAPLRCVCVYLLLTVYVLNIRQMCKEIF